MGAGGGSIAWIDKGGNVASWSGARVPNQALLYDKETVATVTDANVVLGRINLLFLGWPNAVEWRCVAFSSVAGLAEVLKTTVESALPWVSCKLRITTW